MDVAHGKIEELMPKTVYAVSGFTHCPRATDVAALVASNVEDDAKLFQKVVQSNRRAVIDQNPPQHISESARHLWESVLRHHRENPISNVQNGSGYSVVQAKRVAGRDYWRRRSWSVANKP
jgi:hypothetical protein